MSNQLFHGDCLEVMKCIADGSVDAIIADWPYGTTACKWDSIIPLDKLWPECKRVIKDRGAIVLFGNQPFTTALISSNLKWFKYCWVWKKSKPNGWQHARNRPMMTTEDVIVFSQSPMGHNSILGEKRMSYNPQGIRFAQKTKVTAVAHGRMMGARPNQIGKEYDAYTGFPNNVLEYPNVIGKKALHPTQKPLALLEYLVRTYTNEGDTVLDNTMGSGTTGHACANTGRNFIGIERDETYFNVAKARIENAQPVLLEVA